MRGRPSCPMRGVLVYSLSQVQLLCNLMDCSPTGSSVHGIFLGKNIGVCCHSLLQGIFLTQGSNLGLLHCRQILYHLSHLGSEEDIFMIRHSGILCTIVPDNVLHFQLKVEAHHVTLTCVSMSMSASPD